ncbi:hypothetical protein EMWEY_00056570, partial [Eimeria maxima]
TGEYLRKFMLYVPFPCVNVLSFVVNSLNSANGTFAIIHFIPPLPPPLPPPSPIPIPIPSSSSLPPPPPDPIDGL